MPVRIDGDVVDLTEEDTMIGADVFRFTAEGDHAAFLHDSAGSVVPEFVHRDQFAAADAIEEQLNHRLGGLGAISHPPPWFSQTIPDFPNAAFTSCA